MVFIWSVSHRTRTSLLGFQPAGCKCQTASLRTIIPLMKTCTSSGRAGKHSLSSLCKEQLCCREALVHAYGAGTVSTTAKGSEMGLYGKGSTRRDASTCPLLWLCLGQQPCKQWCNIKCKTSVLYSKHYKWTPQKNNALEAGCRRILVDIHV